MIIKGVACAGARRLAVHLTRTDTNERAEVKELRGVAAEDLRGALLEMETVAAGARTTKPFYHSSINTAANERLSDEQRMQAIDRLEDALGLSGQARIIVVHEKEGREHCHIVWSRIDLDRMAAISDSHNYRKHEQVARDLEREFGLERVQGVHIERDGKPRPERTPSHAEMLQAERTGMSPKEVKGQITDLWRSTGTGKEFAASLAEQGYVLARGDRRDFVVIDPMGGTHSLSRRIEGAKAKDVRERMADIDASQLPNVIEAKQIQRARSELAMEAQRVDDEKKLKRSAGDQAEWTNRGGMVEQQRSAMDWVKEAQDHKKAGVERTDRKQAQTPENQEATELSQRRQALLRHFGREIEEGFQNELDQGSGRERSRG
jgi:Relaxase/Mobilisation nuclease domain